MINNFLKIWSIYFQVHKSPPEKGQKSETTSIYSRFRKVPLLLERKFT